MSALAVIRSAAAQTSPPVAAPAVTAASAAPVAALPAAEIPLALLKAPAGFQVELWAAGLADARMLARGSRGTVFVGTRRAGKVYAVIDKGDHRELRVIAADLSTPQGVAFRGGALYVADATRILRYDNIEDRLDHPPVPIVVFDGLPRDDDGRALRFGTDGKLYFAIAAPADGSMPRADQAQLVRLNPINKTIETVALGVRQSLGLDFRPQTQELWFTQQGRPGLGDRLPNDTIGRIATDARGLVHFGYPFCHQGDLPDPEFGRGRGCGEFARPAIRLGAHVGTLGLRFYTGRMFPREYVDNAIVAEHGTESRPNAEPAGIELVRVVVDASGLAQRRERFLSGWIDRGHVWGRPVDLLMLADGSLLVSDDIAGALYRIRYTP